MPRYFFHFASRSERVPDLDGVDLDTLPAAHRYAMRLVRTTVAALAEGEDWRSWRIEIEDAAHRRVLTVLFPASAPPLQDGRRAHPAAAPAACQARR